MKDAKGIVYQMIINSLLYFAIWFFGGGGLRGRVVGLGFFLSQGQEKVDLLDFAIMATNINRMFYDKVSHWLDQNLNIKFLNWNDMSSSYQDTIPKSFHSEQPKRQLSEKSGG